MIKISRQLMQSLNVNSTVRVDASIMSQPVLWVVYTNIGASVQLLGQCIVPYEIYHLINCIRYLLNFHLSSFLFLTEKRIFHF